MSENSLAVEIRADDARGKGPARRLRSSGRVPAVLYGQGKGAVAVTFVAETLERLIRESDAGLNTLIDLAGDAQVAGKTVLVKELQREPVLGRMMHADLYEVDANERIRVSVPIHLSGVPAGVTMGGVMDHALRALELDCFPRAIPDEIVIDVTALELGDSIHVADLDLPPDVELHTPGDASVLSIVAPRAEEEPTVAAEEEAGEDAAAPEDGKEAPEGGDEGGDSSGS